MPKLFANRIPFENKSKHDTPLYQSSFSIFEVSIANDKPFLIDENTFKFIGFVPYVNTVVSNSSPHPVLRGKTFREGIYLGGVQYYKANSTWKHKAVYIMNSKIYSDPKVSFYTMKQVTFSKPGLPGLLNVGDYQYIPCDFENPVRRGSEPKKFFNTIRIHRGPQRKNPDNNYSLGCVTVDPEHFDTLMKFFSLNEMLVYVHKIDRLISDRDNQTFDNIPGFNLSTVSALHREIQSQIEGAKGNYD